MISAEGRFSLQVRSRVVCSPMPSSAFPAPRSTPRRGGRGSARVPRSLGLARMWALRAARWWQRARKAGGVLSDSRTTPKLRGEGNPGAVWGSGLPDFPSGGLFAAIVATGKLQKSHQDKMLGALSTCLSPEAQAASCEPQGVIHVPVRHMLSDSFP